MIFHCYLCGKDFEDVERLVVHLPRCGGPKEEPSEGAAEEPAPKPAKPHKKKLDLL